MAGQGPLRALAAQLTEAASGLEPVVGTDLQAAGAVATVKQVAMKLAQLEDSFIQQLNTLKQQLRDAQLQGAGVVPGGTSPGGGAVGATTPPASGQPSTPADGQVYVSAAAAGAIALISAVVGVAGGYVGRGYLDKQKHAREALEEAPKRKRLPAIPEEEE